MYNIEEKSELLIDLDELSRRQPTYNLVKLFEKIIVSVLVHGSADKKALRGFCLKTDTPLLIINLSSQIVEFSYTNRH